MAIQVYEATKDGQGNSLSVLNRQFISFSYGGKNIEDFGFLAAFTNDRLSKNVYAEFEDTTTNQTELDGQIFWMSSYKPNTLTFSLATDGITEKELENFKRWFIPGTPRELILTEHANRAIMARVSAAPSMSLLPFEEEVEVEVAGQIIKTRTSLYKGEMSLSFIMDDPHWYAIENYFDNAPDEISEEQAKIIYEDGIPYVPSLKINTFLPKEKFYTEREKEVETDGEKKKETVTNVGEPNEVLINLEEENNNYLYYCGTTNEKPIIKFLLDVIFDKDTGKASFGEDENTYYIQLTNTATDDEGQRFNFSLPSILVDYNYALQTVSEFKGTSALDLRKLFRDNMYDYYARAWAISLIDDNEDINADSSFKENKSFFLNFPSKMMKFFGIPKTITDKEGTESYSYTTDMSFTINSANGQATMNCNVAQKKSENLTAITENVGNMIKSNYLIIEPCDSNYYQLTAGIDVKNFTIDYNYKYL